ncbi:MAG: hypothetical protein U0521_18875 [Anaerolineae bacterium]
MTNLRGEVSVAVAAQESGGVYLSFQSGRPNTFGVMEGMEGLDVRVLAVQYKGPRAWLWAGTFAFGDDVGKGCFRWELRGPEDPPSGWFTFDADWKAGSCRALAFMGDIVFAATHRGGIVRLDSTKQNPKWETPDINSGLPLRDLARGRFTTVDTLAANPAGALMLAGVAGSDDQPEGQGVYRAADQGAKFAQWKFERASTSRFTDKVTLPETWLFASGEHEITVVSEDETR